MSTEPDASLPNDSEASVRIQQDSKGDRNLVIGMGFFYCQAIKYFVFVEIY